MKHKIISLLILVISWLSGWLINATTTIIHPAFYWTYGTVFSYIAALVFIRGEE